MKYFKLSGSCTIFNDPTQPDNDLKTLYPKQSLALKETSRVKRALSNGAIELVDEKEAKEINSKREKGISESKEVAKKLKEKYKKTVSAENESLQKELQQSNNKLSEKELEFDILKEEKLELEKKLESDKKK